MEISHDRGVFRHASQHGSPANPIVAAGESTRKMNMLAQLNAAARMLALAGLRSQYPQASEAELRRKLADLLLGEELARKVYGDLPHAK